MFKTVIYSFYLSCGSELHDNLNYLRRRLYLHLIYLEGFAFYIFLLPNHSFDMKSSQFLFKVSCFKCLPSYIIWHNAANFSKSFFFEESNGYFWKCGITFPIKSFMLRTSYLKVRSLGFLRIVPQSRRCWNNFRTSWRSPFVKPKSLDELQVKFEVLVLGKKKYKNFLLHRHILKDIDQWNEY